MANLSNDHRVQMPATQGFGRRKAAATPEKHLNRFICIVVFTERAGNGLGMLAFTWATVVLLRGFSSDLFTRDFWSATLLVFLEAGRMFSRNNRLDYQLFFRTRGAFRPLGWIGLIVVVGLLYVSFGVVGLAILSFGNLQIPAALVRVGLAWMGLTSHTYGVDARTNLVPSLHIFYGMVLGQGILYIVACMLEVFSFIPRRSLVRSVGFKGQWGLESVNLYYKYAFEKCMEGGVLAPKKISLIAFAEDYLNSDSSKNQLYGIRMLHIFLQRESTKAQLLSKLAASTKTTARLIRMLDWTSPEDKAIRLFAAKVTIELAKSLQVTTIPGTMQLVSALLDADDEQEETQDQTLNAADNQEETHDPILNTDNLPETPTPPTRSTQQVGTAAQNSCVRRCWQRISEFWSIPKEEPLKDHDLLPVMGMSIIGSLAGCDQDNCVEISKAADLIPKIVGFTGYRIDTTNTEAQQKVLVKSSLEVLQRLTKIDGEIGITLRYKISEDPFLLNNLAEILEDSSSSQELRELTIDIITKLAMDAGIRQEIGSIQVILTKLMYAFLARDGPSNAHSDCSMPIKAGQALAMLTLESVDNCSAILKEPGVEFIKDLARMLHEDRYRYMAASLLRNLCTHSRAELSDSDLGELSHALPEVLERVMDAERKELEVLVGISSQICSLVPESFMQALEQGPNEARFVDKLVNALNVKCPGIRRVVIEQSISMMELNSRYAKQFRDRGLKDALSRVEKTPSRAEKYRLFLGNAGLMEHSTHLSSLVVRAKQLMTMH